MKLSSADDLFLAALMERRHRLAKFTSMGRKPRNLKSKSYRRDRVLWRILTLDMNYRARMICEAHKNGFFE